MARPKEQGLKYFSFDVDFFNDEKIEAISGEFGIKGEIATIKLLCAVYRNGYFIEWSEMLKMKLLRNLTGVSSDLLEQIVNRLVKWEFFDEHLFNSVRVLTSKGIQKRYFDAIKRRKQTEEYQYLLVNVDINYSSVGINANINAQSKGKNIKKPSKEGKEIIVDDRIFDKPLLECYEEILSNNSWIEAVVMNKRASGHLELTLDSFKEFLKRFFDKLQNEGETHKNPKDGMSHFVRWLDIELNKPRADKYMVENECLLESTKNDADSNYNRFLLRIKSHFPYCFANMKMPTPEQVSILLKKQKDIGDNALCVNALRIIEGRVDIRGKWDNLYLAIMNQIKYMNGS